MVKPPPDEAELADDVLVPPDVGPGAGAGWPGLTWPGGRRTGELAVEPLEVPVAGKPVRIGRRPLLLEEVLPEEVLPPDDVPETPLWDPPPEVLPPGYEPPPERPPPEWTPSWPRAWATPGMSKAVPNRRGPSQSRARLFTASPSEAALEQVENAARTI